MEIKQWYSASELEGLPGVPKYVPNIVAKSKKENWQSRPRQGQGGGNEFNLDSLPELTRKHLYLEHLKKVQGSKDKELEMVDINVAKLNTLKPFQQKKLDARIEVLNAYKSFKRYGGLGVTKAREEFSTLYNNRSIDLSDLTFETIKSVSPKTLQRLEQSKSEDLIVNYGCSSLSIIDRNDELKKFVISVVFEKPDVRATHIYKMIKIEFKQFKISKMTVIRWLNKWKKDNESVYLSFANPDAHKNRFLPAQGSLSADITRFNELWELDSTPADVMTTDGRYSIVGVVDVFSRRAKVILSKTSDSKAVCRVMRKAIAEWGVPEMIKTDNGKDYASKHFTQAMATLGIEQTFCNPYQGQEKPHVERFFGTMTRDLFELLDGYIGHSVADRKGIESRMSFANRLGTDEDVLYNVKLSKDELQEKMDLWIENAYEHEEHRTIKMSPWKKYTTCRAVTKIISNIRQLDMLLTESVIRTVSKKGIQIDGVEYYGAELATYIRKQVKCIYDNEDMGRLYVYDIDNHKFIGVAMNAENAGANREEWAAKAKKLQKAADAEGRKAIRKAKSKITVTNAVERLYQPNPTGNKAVAQKLEVEYVAQTLQEANSALNASEKPIVIAQDKTKLKEVMAINTVISKETPKQRFAKWMLINERKLAGEVVSKSEEYLHKSYQQSSEFTSQVRQKEMFGDFQLNVA